MPTQCSYRLWIITTTLAAASLAAAPPVSAQYPGQITNDNKNSSELRAVAVLEWTGDADHPKASRIIPVCIYDGQDLQDAGIYLARPAPLALQNQVEYQLQWDGKPVGLFDIENATREQGSWVGYGKLKPLPRPVPASAQRVKIDEEQDAASDVPILHRKHASGDSGGSGGSSTDPIRAIRLLLSILTAPRCIAPALRVALQQTRRAEIPATPAPPAELPRNPPILTAPRCIAAPMPPQTVRPAALRRMAPLAPS